MADRKNLLARLRKMFGDSSRQTFLQRLYNFDNDIKSDDDNDVVDNDIKIDDDNDSEPTEPPSSQVKIIDINGTDSWLNHVRALKNISVLNACLARYENLLRKTSMIVYYTSVQKSLTAILNYVDKYFKEPQDITDETSEEVARQTGKFVKEYVLNLLKSCHRGKLTGRSEEFKFYEDFEAALESYLETICVYRESIDIGADIRINAKWFETPITKESPTPEKIGTIAEIEFVPHIIHFRNDNGVQEDMIIRGMCIVFAQARQR